MSKKIIETNKAPKAIGPYSQAVKTGSVVYCSGQIGLHPETMQLVEESVDGQTRQVMENLGRVLEAAGLDYRDIVKATIYVTDIACFDEVNRIYSGYFDKAPPARETVGVRSLPGGAKVEVSCIATSD
jgi:2-iminobutanoate/2-iminopropanoate deaminase